MTDCCPACGQPLPLPSLDTRAAATSVQLDRLLREQGRWQTGDGRIGEADAALLLGWSTESLRNARTAGHAPPSYRLGGAGHRVTYRVAELARWIEQRREE